MGALAPVTHWLPQDDLLLKSAVEAGASLESLAKGAVKFSRRFTVQELQDRWYSLLYDPVVSEEASVHMIEFERSASAAQSKSNKIENNRVVKCILGKRKAENVRKRYYAMRKRIRNEPFDLMDLNFLCGPGHDYAGNENEPTSTDFLLGEQVPNYFGVQELNLGVVDRPLAELGTNRATSSSDGFSAAAFCTGFDDHDSISLGQNNEAKNLCPPFDDNVSLTRDHNSIKEHGLSTELQVCDLLESVKLEVKPQLMSGENNDKEGNKCTGSGSDSDHRTSLQNVIYSSPVPEMPVLSTVDSVSASTLPDVCFGDNGPHAEDESVSSDAMDGHNRSRCVYGIVYSKSELKDKTTCGNMNDLTYKAEEYCSDQITCGNMKDLAPNAEEYFEQLSNSLLNFTPEDELLFMDADGKDIIDKSYFDNLSSLLLDFPDESDMPGLGLPEASVAPEECLSIPSAANHVESGDKQQYPCGDKRLVWSAEAQKLSSALTVNPAFPELRNGVICCTLNIEDTEIPNNDDVFLPIWMPSPSVSLMRNANFDEANYPMTSSVKEFSHGQRATDRVMMRGEQSTYVQLHVPNIQMTESRLISEVRSNSQINDHGLRFELPCSDVQHVALKKTGTSECLNTSNISHLSKKDIIPESLRKSFIKVEQSEILNHNSGDSQVQKQAEDFDTHSTFQKNDIVCKQEAGGTYTAQKEDVIHAEFCSIENAVPEKAVNNTLSDQEEFSCESNDEVPYFSDVEAMILDMDLSPDDQDTRHSSGVLKYQHEEAKRAIIRLEQAANAYMQRSIAAQGAYAVLYGRRSKHFIKKTEVLLGRGTEDVKVDIDLGGEARANKISRRQATVKMEIDGSFHLRNHGKCPLFVNGKEVLPGHLISLISGCLIEIGRITFVFETSRTLCKAC